ncbi:MAG: TraR/DksA family transcriptional regulator [Desulfobacteraceae bacterium]|nr:TraR/DksA family transcriptional regulator [Desulfobacteraceae bacterium]
MSIDDILFLRTMLLDKRSGILERVKKLAAAWQEMEERVIELEEEAQKASIARPYDQLNENGRLEIEQIDLALTKMAIGEYGICESCGDDISPRRLRVLPWARLCVECAQDFEKNHTPLPQTTEVMGAGKIPDDLQGLSTDQMVAIIYERLHSDERIETEGLKIAIRKGVLFLDGTLADETEHEIILQILTDSMGFSSIVDRIEIHDGSGEEQGDAEGFGDPLYFDRDDNSYGLRPGIL